MRGILRRGFACFLAMTLVLTMGNGYGITLVYASENSKFESQSTPEANQEGLVESSQSSNTLQDETVSSNSSSVRTISTSMDIDGETIDGDVVIDGGSQDIIVTFNNSMIDGNVTIKNGLVTFYSSTVTGVVSAKDAPDSTRVTFDMSTIHGVSYIENCEVKHSPRIEQFSNVENLYIDDVGLTIDVSGASPVAPVFKNIFGSTFTTLRMYTGTSSIPVGADNKPVVPLFTGEIDLGTGRSQVFVDGLLCDKFRGNDHEYVKYQDEYYLLEDLSYDPNTGEFTLNESTSPQDVSGLTLTQDQWSNTVNIEYVSNMESEDYNDWEYIDLAQLGRDGKPYVAFSSDEVAKMLLYDSSQRIYPNTHDDSGEYYRTNLDGIVYTENTVSVYRYIGDDTHTAEEAFHNAWHREGYMNLEGYIDVDSVSNALRMIRLDVNDNAGEYYEVHYKDAQIIDFDISNITKLKGLRIISDPGYDDESDQMIPPITTFGNIILGSGQTVELCSVKAENSEVLNISGAGELAFNNCRIKQPITGDGHITVASYGDSAFTSLNNLATYALSNNVFILDKLGSVQGLELRDNATILTDSETSLDIRNVSHKEVNISDDSTGTEINVDNAGYSLEIFQGVSEDGEQFADISLTGTFDAGNGWNTYYEDDTSYRIYYIDEVNGTETLRHKYIYYNGSWYKFNDDFTIGDMVPDLEISGLHPDIFAYTARISMYQGMVDKDSFDINTNLYEDLIEGHSTDYIETAQDKKLVTVDQNILESCNYNLSFDFSNKTLNLCPDVIWNDYIVLKKDGDVVKRYAIDYQDGKATNYYIELTNASDYVGYAITEDQYNSYLDNQNIEATDKRVAGSIQSILESLKDETYVYIENVQGLNTAGEAAVVPYGQHVILASYQAESYVNSITLENNASLVLSGNVKGNLTYNGSSNSKLVLYNANIDGSIVGNQQGTLVLRRYNSLSGLRDIPVCEIKNLEDLSIRPDSSGNYHEVTFGEIQGNQYFHISYCGYPENMLPKFAGAIDLGPNTVYVEDKEYDVWYDENGTQYILKDDQFYAFSYEEDGVVVEETPTEGIYPGIVWNNPNNLCVSYYDASTYDTDHRELLTMNSGDGYIQFGTDAVALDLIVNNWVNAGDYGDFFIDVDGKLYRYDQPHLSVSDLNEENFNKIGKEGFYFNHRIPSANPSNALRFASQLNESYAALFIEGEGQSLGEVTIPANLSGLAMIADWDSYGNLFRYDIRKVNMKSNQTVVFENLRTENASPLEFALSDEKTGGTVFFHNARVNQEVIGHKGINIELLENCTFKSLKNFDSLVAKGCQLIVEEELSGLGGITVTADSSLIGKATSTLVFPEITSAKRTAKGDGSNIEYQEEGYYLDLYQEKKEDQMASLTFTDAIDLQDEWLTYEYEGNYYPVYQNTSSGERYFYNEDWYVITDDGPQILPVIPPAITPETQIRRLVVQLYNYVPDIDGDNCYGEKNFNYEVFDENKLSFDGIEECLFTMNHPDALKANLNEYFMNRICYYYKDLGLYFSNKPEYTVVMGPDIRCMGLCGNDDTQKTEVSSKYALCKVDYQDIWNELTIAAIMDQTYTGSALTPLVTLVGERSLTNLTVGTHYMVQYANNKAVGTATVTVQGIGVFSGLADKKITFTITPKSLKLLNIPDVASQTYSGKELKPLPTVKDGSSVLKQGVDYEIKWENNTNVGTAKVIVTGKGNYKDSITKTFVIKPLDISSATLTVASATYTGKALQPAVTVKVGTLTLTTKDYKVTYSNNTNAGKGSVTVTGTGNYIGKRSTTFTIKPKAISPTVSSIAKQVYTGKAITPSLTVKDGKVTLVKDKDYTLSYKSNTSVGKAYVTIKGKGNYSFTKTVSFTIYIKKGTTITYGDYKYKVTYVSGTTVKLSVASWLKKSETKIVIGSTIKIGSTTCYITSIESKAFMSNSKVKSVVIGKYVESIGSYAFSKCSKLSSITISSTKLKSVGSSALKGIYSKAVIKVPKSKLKTYTKLLKGKGQSSSVKIKS